jgi:hypothetical protein
MRHHGDGQGDEADQTGDYQNDVFVICQEPADRRSMYLFYDARFRENNEVVDAVWWAETSSVKLTKDAKALPHPSGALVRSGLMSWPTVRLMAWSMPGTLELNVFFVPMLGELSLLQTPTFECEEEMFTGIVLTHILSMAKMTDTNFNTVPELHCKGRVLLDDV